jgi:protein-L-isoaspartate(D-aspartate) O-methyltransferase
MPIDFEQARFAMVEQQIRPYEVLDTRVLDTLSAIKREDFVSPRHRKLAFADLALPLEHGEFMFKPVLEGRLLQALDLAPEDEVLEIGTGSGFVTACLAHLARAVTSIDLHSDFVERARGRLSALGMSCARIETADVLSYEPGRQYDAIAVTGAVAQLPERWRGWLKPGGRLFVVRGESPAQEAVTVRRNGESDIRIESLFETDLPYLRGAAPVERFTL